METLPMGTAYAVGKGIGASGSAILGMILWRVKNEAPYAIYSDGSRSDCGIKASILKEVNHDQG